MRVKVKQIFRDINDYSVVYNAGEEREFIDSRAQHLISLGLVEPIIEPAKEPAKEVEKPIKEVKEPTLTFAGVAEEKEQKKGKTNK